MSQLTQPTERVSPAALALMLVMVFLSLYEAGFDHNVLYWVLLPFTLLTALLIYKNKINIKLSIKLPMIWLFLFILWAGISIFWSLNPHRTLVEFLQLSLFGLVFITAANLSSDNILRLGRIILFVGFGISLFGLSQYLFLDSSRLESTLANANTMGIYMVMLYLFGWGFYLRRPSSFLAAICVTVLTALTFLIHIGGDFSFNFPATGALFILLTAVIANPYIATGDLKAKPQVKISAVIAILLVFGLASWQFTAHTLYRQGVFREAEGELKEAADTYDLANRIYPINSMAFSFAANTYYQLAAEGNNLEYLDEAILRANKAVALSPVDGNLQNQLTPWLPPVESIIIL